MKDTVIRFRCTEEDRAMIEQMAMQSGETLTEYILGLIMADRSNYEMHEFEVVVIRQGKEIGRKDLGAYATDHDRRASKYTTWKALDKAAEEYFSTFKTQPQQRYEIVEKESGSKVVTNAMSDYMWF